MGCVLSVGHGQAPARQAALAADLPLSAGATMVNKMCGSGMKAAMMAHDLLRAGSADIVVAGGMESMSNAPYLLPKARAGQRMGHGQVIDHMFLDGLEDAYDRGRLMGAFADDCAEAHQFTREAQDGYALTSLARADKVPTLKPAFREGRMVTAANASSISDRAAALILMHASEAARPAAQGALRRS